MAGLHYNEISCVTKMYNRQGEACFTLRYPKGSKGQSVVCPDKTKSTYGMNEFSLKVYFCFFVINKIMHSSGRKLNTEILPEI